MEITKVIKPFIRKEWPNTFCNIVYLLTDVTVCCAVQYIDTAAPELQLIEYAL